MDEIDSFVTLPHYLVTRLCPDEISPQHFVESYLTHLWEAVDHAHAFIVGLDPTSNTWVSAWVSAPPEYWEAWLNKIHQESVEDVQDVLAGFEALLAEAPDAEDPNA